MGQLDLARWQFALTSIYHFVFVPVTIGFGFLTAILQTLWHRHHDEAYLKLTRFFGVLLIINVAVGVVTGLVQEFQFGMDWSQYSRTVGNVFGAPLAMEGIAAFFLESTFLGLWVFGWDKLSPRVHLLCIWAVAFGAALSALFILAANSWMQHPVGYTIDRKTGRPQLNNIWALFTNKVFLWGYLHVLMASLVTGAVVMLAISAWRLRRGTETDLFHHSAKVSLIVLLPAILIGMFAGGRLGVNETAYQPMKIAAAEAQWTTCQPCSFSLFQIGGGKNDETPTQIIEIPHLLSLLATSTWNGKVDGLNEVNSQYQKTYGPGNYVPNVFIQYWSMRVMAYAAVLLVLLALSGLWQLRRKRLDHSRRLLWIAVWAVPLPFVMNTAGWLLTESGRQPWIVQGLELTKNGVSPSVSKTMVIISLVAIIGVYTAMAVIDIVLMLRFARKEIQPPPPTEDVETPLPAMSY
jgi:cytochrome d ubiquinol oxidase subunit I